MNKGNNLSGTHNRTSKLAQLRQNKTISKAPVDVEAAIDGYASSIDSKKMMEEIARNSALVNLIFDNSPSMEGTSEPITEELNGFATRQRVKIYTTKISLTLFNSDEIYRMLSKVDVKQFIPLSPWGYNGGTNIYDALINAITPILPKDANHRLHLIVTDGINGSSSHTQQDVRKLITSRIDEHFFLLYHEKHATISIEDYAKDLGIRFNRAVNFNPYGDGIKIIFQTIEYMLDGLRTNGAVPEDWAKAITAHNNNPLGVRAREVKLLN